MKKTSFKFNYSFATAKGLRDHNEDAGWVGENKSKQCLAIVCDGIGSQTDSQIASNMIVDYFKTQFNKKRIILNPDLWVKKTLATARKKLTNHCKKNLQGKKITTTFCMCLIKRNGMMHCYSLGDSRLYHFISNKFKWVQITKDHNLYNYLVDSNASQETFVKFKDKFLALTKFVDSDPTYPLSFDKFNIQLENGDLVFIGSDGVYNFINMFFIDEYIKKNRNIPFSETSKALIKEALKNYSNDNLTAIVIEGFNR